MTPHEKESSVPGKEYIELVLADPAVTAGRVKKIKSPGLQIQSKQEVAATSDAMTPHEQDSPAPGKQYIEIVAVPAVGTGRVEEDSKQIQALSTGLILHRRSSIGRGMGSNSTYPNDWQSWPPKPHHISKK